MFKHNHGFTKYLTFLPTYLSISFSKFRCINHKLPIEIGRFLGNARDARICNLCNSAKLGDGYHYIFECDNLKRLRKKLITQEYYKNTTLKNTMISKIS